MTEIISRAFVIGVLLLYVGLVMAFLLWNLGRWLRGAGKKRPRSGVLERSNAQHTFNHPFGAR